MSYVYVAESGCGMCKIGKSKDPELRVKSIKNETGLEITNFKFFKCNGDSILTEKSCHSIAGLRYKNIFKEWFRIPFDKACELVKSESEIGYQNDYSTNNETKFIYECQSTRVPVDLVKAVKKEHAKRAKKNPKLRVIDIWAELIEKV